MEKGEKSANNHEKPLIHIKPPRKLTIILTGIALGIMVIYFHSIGLEEIIETIVDVNIFLLFFSVFLYFLAKFWDSLGWREILKTMGIKPKIFSIYRVHITSLAGCIALPSAGAVETGLKIYLGQREFINPNEKRKANSAEILSSIVIVRTLALFLILPLSFITAFGATTYLGLSIESTIDLLIQII